METTDKIKNLKKLHAMLESKTHFATVVADYYDLRQRYVLEKYFQGHWAIPSERVDTIISIAQNMLRNSADRIIDVLPEKMEILPFDFESKTNTHLNNNR